MSKHRPSIKSARIWDRYTKATIESLEMKLKSVRESMADAAKVKGAVALSLYEQLAREEKRLLSEITKQSKQITFHLD